MRRLPAILAALFVAALATAGTLVDQGAPGKQGAWPVSVTAGTITIVIDGGLGGSISTYPSTCSTIREQNTDAGTVALRVPSSGPLAGRIWVRICNSLLNSSGSQCICSATTCPSYTAGSVGDPLAVSDCVLYNVGAADGGVPCCICNGAGIWLPSQECIAP